MKGAKVNRVFPSPCIGDFSSKVLNFGSHPGSRVVVNQLESMAFQFLMPNSGEHTWYFSICRCFISLKT